MPAAGLLANFEKRYCSQIREHDELVAIKLIFHCVYKYIA